MKNDFLCSRRKRRQGRARARIQVGSGRMRRGLGFRSLNRRGRRRQRGERKEMKVEHEVAGCKVRGRAREMEGNADIVRLEGGEG